MDFTTEELSLHPCHEAKAGGVATPYNPRHSAHGPGSEEGRDEPQTAEKRLQAKERGLCTKCHREPAGLSKARCEQCRKKIREYVARKEAEAKQAKYTGE